jgi:molybdopterin-containing oxidoreductase family membrane subunit
MSETTRPGLWPFFWTSFKRLFQGDWRYWLWMGVLALITIAGVIGYVSQLRNGLMVTGMSDQISWGFYIANFAFLVGIAASAVLLVIPAYIFHRQDVKDTVLLGESVAVAAVLMAMLFVIVDLGRPDRVWHMIPVLGSFNFPISLLAWDVVVLSGYLVLNVAIPFYILYRHFQGEEPKFATYFPWVILAMFWAISIHTVTAFLFSANPARPFWHTSLLGPRFIASAFASGPALMILALQVIRRVTEYPVSQSVVRMLALIMAIALQISIFFVIAELFTDFYNQVSHAASIHYLFFGLFGNEALKPWIWTALAMNAIALLILMIHPLRENMRFLNVACVLAFIGIWIEKGMGLVIPGFIPTPLGEIAEYAPSMTEVVISLGIWAFGLMVFTMFAKMGIPIELAFRRRAPSVSEKRQVASAPGALPVEGS